MAEAPSPWLARIIDAHRALPLAGLWADGSSASSGGQFLPAGGRGEAAGEVNARHGNEPGVDEVRTTLSTYVQPFHAERLAYIGTGNFAATGSAWHNRIAGGAGNDTLDGGAGNDTLLGGAGDDVYVLDSAADVVTEAVAAGIDEVRVTMASFTLGANLERLLKLGSGGFSGTGNELANLLVGNSGGDTLSGLAGADTLDGGAGSDLFRFAPGQSVAATPDRVTDFSKSDADRIDLRDLFSVLGQPLTVLGEASFTGQAGQLRWGAQGTDTLIQVDMDGDGAGDIAIILTGAVALTSQEFIV